MNFEETIFFIFVSSVLVLAGIFFIAGRRIK
jgi:hypothetical protein